jgi:Glycosyltransferase
MCGVVSIASNVPPFSQEIENWKNGILVENTSASWLEAMEQVTTNASLRRKMLARAIQNCQQNASPAISLAAWKNVFRGLPRPDRWR